MILNRWNRIERFFYSLNRCKSMHYRWLMIQVFWCSRRSWSPIGGIRSLIEWLFPRWRWSWRRISEFRTRSTAIKSQIYTHKVDLLIKWESIRIVQKAVILQKFFLDSILRWRKRGKEKRKNLWQLSGLESFHYGIEYILIDIERQGIFIIFFRKFCNRMFHLEIHSIKDCFDRDKRITLTYSKWMNKYFFSI